MFRHSTCVLCYTVYQNQRSKSSTGGVTLVNFIPIAEHTRSIGVQTVDDGRAPLKLATLKKTTVGRAKRFSSSLLRAIPLYRPPPASPSLPAPTHITLLRGVAQIELSLPHGEYFYVPHSILTRPGRRASVSSGQQGDDDARDRERERRRSKSPGGFECVSAASTLAR
jgi:hypothetical protein